MHLASSSIHPHVLAPQYTNPQRPAYTNNPRTVTRTTVPFEWRSSPWLNHRSTTPGTSHHPTNAYNTVTTAENKAKSVAAVLVACGKSLRDSVTTTAYAPARAITNVSTARYSPWSAGQHHEFCIQVSPVAIAICKANTRVQTKARTPPPVQINKGYIKNTK